ncbi:sporulation protein YqfC [Fictibacillus enclensis]|uniref:Sporulation protein YqfC n=3 Tax=Fictibacillus TaxID=1329200 RepID=A0A0V8JG39_9BACL|nr:MULTISPECIES: sporulation protein YqfC [Fictibacillus]KSU86031.1 sporulation protein YqfC [Fictibacillus enclensis]MDM5199762.1 sporulation protein YqfC [Fictibacillus enclensis]MDM5339001.1 sporulation protein YqfC [Fictibacillus enclensis]RXZ02526.1 sporulation protein YqfC [Fictibacillus sp. S7]WHY74986.1 sporulation protein YqfC [Fictibacillus enclensis]
MMAKWRQQVTKWLVEKLDLPADAMMDLPRITMIGQLHIYIENHRGVMAFSREELKLRLKQGHLVIKGQDFVIKTILPEEILLEGTIEGVYYDKST